MRALVTGCAGFVGSHLAESLLGEGHEVLGVDCFNDNYDRDLKAANLALLRWWPSFRFTRADLAGADLPALLDGADVVFHLAAEPGVRTSWGRQFDRYLRNNVLVTQRLLEASRAEPERRIVYASSSSVYGNALRLPTAEDTLPRPYSPYGLTKLSAEQLCGVYHANHGVQTVALRLFTAYGPRQRPDMAFHRFCRAVLEHRPIELFGDGAQTRDFTYVDDVVAAFRAAAVAPAAGGRVYNVGGGSRVSLNDALALLAEAAHRPLDVRRGAREAGDVRHTAADITRAREELEYAPSTPLEVGLSVELEWMAARRPRRIAQRASGAASTVG